MSMSFSLIICGGVIVLALIIAAVVLILNDRKK